jgi:hypothetical protein
LLRPFRIDSDGDYAGDVPDFWYRPLETVLQAAKSVADHALRATTAACDALVLKLSITARDGGNLGHIYGNPEVITPARASLKHQNSRVRNFLNCGITREEAIIRYVNIKLLYERACLEAVTSRVGAVRATKLIADRYSRYREIIISREKTIDTLRYRVGTLEGDLELSVQRLGDYLLSASGNRGALSLSPEARTRVKMSSVKHWLKGSASNRALVQELKFAHSFIRDMRASHAAHVDFL